MRTETDRYRATQLRINVAAALGQVGGDLPARLLAPRHGFQWEEARGLPSRVQPSSVSLVRRRGSGAPSQGSRWGAPTWLRFLFVAPPVARAVALLAARRLWWGWDVRRDDTAGSGPDHSITGGCWLKLSTRRHVGGAGAKSGLSARLAIERNPHALSIVE